MFLQRGSAWRHLGQHDKAAADFRRALVLDPLIHKKITFDVDAYLRKHAR